MFPTDWSTDGQWVLYSAPGSTAWDIFALRMGDSTAHPVVQSPQNQIQARLSPNGRWIGYASDESGRFEVYVQSFDDASGKTLVSTRGGSQPTWRRDGRELFYIAADGSDDGRSRHERIAIRARFRAHVVSYTVAGGVGAICPELRRSRGWQKISDQVGTDDRRVPHHHGRGECPAERWRALVP